MTPHEIVLWKPPGLASELPRDPSADSVVTRLHSEGFRDVRLVHRLDSPACGLLLVARTAAAAAHYSAEIAARRWQKFYVADVAAPVETAAGLIGEHKAYLATEGRRATVVRSGGRPSFLAILHAARAPEAADRSHVLIQLRTGRFHQIRVMLAALGAALAGDVLYGGPEGRFYLEHVVLGAIRPGDSAPTTWRAPSGVARPEWDRSLLAAVESVAHSTETNRLP